MSSVWATTEDELRRMLDDLLLVRHVANPLQACDAEADGLEVRRRMEQACFEVLGVRSGDKLIGTVHRRQLRTGPCGEQLEPLSDEQLIAGDAPLLELLRRLHTRRWLYVRQPSGDAAVAGFVSRGDLQRPAVRMLLFGLLTLFEMQLLDMVQRCYDDDTLSRTLKPSRLEAARKLHAEREKRGEQLRLADCLQIADKRDLLLAADGFAELFGFDSKKSAHRFFTQVEALRDRLVHAQDLIAGSSWEEMTEITARLAEFLRRYEGHRTRMSELVRAGG